ncbi:EI24 domain-containing protein [Synechococcus sp. PCC 7336]|uniref:EI24 domain-containing protein n=1 Tax=Synechococcus sp. PCC 7336 TaxID=195250 RepID=UPI00034D7856|nr:EI24 domain-containing protein [Synechococcus sp. PCC 7336]
MSIPALANYQPERGPIYQFCTGLRFGWAGLCLFVRSPRLQLLGLVPIALTGGSFAALLWFGVTLVGSWLDRWLAALPQWLTAFAEVVGSSVVAIALLLVAYLLFLPLVGIVAGPFRDAIAMHTERLVRGTVTDEGLGLWATVRGLFELIGFQMSVLVALIAIGVAAPGIGTVLSVAIAIFLTALDMVDPALGLRGYLLARKLRFVGQNIALLAGFGLASFLVFSIPVLNLAILPVATTGGTLLAIAATEGDRSPSEQPVSGQKKY